MNLQEFISKFASQFEDEDPSVFRICLNLFIISCKSVG